jgi:uncharacterized protein (UPF0335 family)
MGGRLNQNKLNQKLKKLIRQLGEAIHETVSESEDIAGVVKDIREEGFDVMLMLEATIGLNELEDAEKAEVAAEQVAQDKEPFNAHDLNFLKSLRITLEDVAEGTAVESASDSPANPPAGSV